MIYSLLKTVNVQLPVNFQRVMSEDAELLDWFQKQIYKEIQRPRNIGKMSITASPITKSFFNRYFEDNKFVIQHQSNNKKVIRIDNYESLEFLLGAKSNWIEVDALVSGKKDGYYKINSRTNQQKPTLIRISRFF